MIHTDGRWNPNEEPIYFIATNETHVAYSIGSSKNVLIAVNEIVESNIEYLTRAADAGINIFIDSGVFNLTNEHKRRHDITMDAALALAPHEIDGFDQLFETYTRLIDKLRDKVWGYIEIDQGGRENKIKTRQRLEDLGYRPIPVYHPLNDGWEYFDYLAERYDRICFGNIVQAEPEVRKRLIATACERKKKYPNLWIHILGLSPNDFNISYPINSADSSSWVGMTRWGPTFFKSRSMMKKFDCLSRNFMHTGYKETANSEEYDKCVRLQMTNAHFDLVNWRAILREYETITGVTNEQN